MIIIFGEKDCQTNSAAANTEDQKWFPNNHQLEGVGLNLFHNNYYHSRID